MTSVVAFTRQGCGLGQRLAHALDGTLYTPQRYAEEFSASGYGVLQAWIKAQFTPGNQIIFVSAAGIAVRTIAPWVKDKFTDPAVVSVDELGRFAVPLLSGHVGGANDLARKVAAITGGEAVISTATDVNGLFAVDEWARKNDLCLVDPPIAKELSSALLEGTPVGFVSELPVVGELPREIEANSSDLGIYVGTDPHFHPFPKTLHLLPRDLILGIGCKRGTTQDRLEEQIRQVLESQNLSLQRVWAVATIDLKKDEAGLQSLCESHRWPLLTFSADELKEAKGDFTPSAFVASVTGVDNVCERASVCAGGTLRIPKQAAQGVTVAVAQRSMTIQF
jgi:cobalt-precorrin 5A hydrolase